MTIPTALVASRSAVLLPAGGQDELVRRVRAAIIEEDAFSALIGVFTGLGILDLPPFACAVADDHGLRVLVRGAGSALVAFADGRTANVAAQDGVATWREETFDGVTAVELTSQDAAPGYHLELVVAPVEAPLSAKKSVDSDARGGLEPRPVAQSNADAVMVRSRSTVQSPSAADATLLRHSDDIEVRVAEEPPLDPPARPPSMSDDEFDFAHLLEETHYRGVEAAAVRDDVHSVPPGAEGRESAGDPTRTALTLEVASSSTESIRTGSEELIASVPSRPEPVLSPDRSPLILGDHDGHTVSVDALRVVREQIHPTGFPPPQVQAVFCVNRHPNPPNAPICRRCAGGISDRSIREIARPSLGLLQISTGASVELDRSLLVGRRPTVGGVEPSELVRFVVIPDPDHSLSRLHAEVRLEGWEVLVVDLGSKNGTYVQIPGQSPTKLRAREPYMVVPGTRMRLGDTVELRYEVPGS